MMMLEEFGQYSNEDKTMGEHAGHMANGDREWGNTAVDGLIARLIAGVAMMAYLLAVALVTAQAPRALLRLFDPIQSGDWPTGLLTHLAVSVTYGLIFALALAGLA